LSGLGAQYDADAVLQNDEGHTIKQMMAGQASKFGMPQ
jgi:hypothetical protein